MIISNTLVWPYEYYKKFISHLFVTRLKNTVMIFRVSYLLTNMYVGKNGKNEMRCHVTGYSRHHHFFYRY